MLVAGDGFSPSQSDELPTALTRDGIYTKIPHYEDNFE